VIAGCPMSLDLVFVVIWSSGWIVAKYAAPHADPLTFLSVRYAVAALIIFVFGAVMMAPRPKSAGEARDMLVSGVLIHAIYLGGVWWAIAQGVPAGVSALLVAIQPLLATVLAKPLSGETISPTRWAGVVIGFLGIALVLQPKLAATDWARLDGLVVPLLVNVVSSVSVTLGTFHQKRRLPTVDLRTLAAWQFLGALIVTLPVALLIEPNLRFDLVPESFYALAWSVVVMSIIAIGLMLLMIRHGSVARVSAVIYLVPPTAALQAWAMFGETLSPVQLLGMGVVALGVYLATRK
jgi:drug/metabolite transporter (DMT)-like permease